MTYNVFDGTLNITQSINQNVSRVLAIPKSCVVVVSVMVYISTDGTDVAAVNNEKVLSKSADAGAAALWQQVLEYNTSQNTTVKSAAESSAVEHGHELKHVILVDSDCEVGSCLVGVLSPEDEGHSLKDEPDAGNPDTGRYLTVEAVSHTGQDSSKKAPRSRSDQDLSKLPEVTSAHHRSAESLLSDRPRTLPQLARLQTDDGAVLSRRRSFSGAMHKAAAAVAVGCRGLRDSLKAISADLRSGSGDDGQDERTAKSKKASSTDLGQQTS